MFFPSGFEHSLTSHAGAAWARSPWEAVQRAAADALHKLEAGKPAPRDWTRGGRVASVKQSAQRGYVRRFLLTLDSRLAYLRVTVRRSENHRSLRFIESAATYHACDLRRRAPA